MSERPLNEPPQRESLFDLAPKRIRPGATCDECGARREEGDDTKQPDCIHDLERAAGAPLERYPRTCVNAPDPKHDPIPY